MRLHRKGTIWPSKPLHGLLSEDQSYVCSKNLEDNFIKNFRINTEWRDPGYSYWKSR